MSGPNGYMWNLWAEAIQERPRGAHALTVREHQILVGIARRANRNWRLLDPPLREARPPAGANDAAAWPGNDSLQRYARCGHGAVSDAITGLQRHGLLIIQRRGRGFTPIYWFGDAQMSEPSDGCQACARRLEADAKKRERGVPRGRPSEPSEPSEVLSSEPSDATVSEPSDVLSSEPSDAEVEVNSEDDLSGRTRSPCEGDGGESEGNQCAPAHPSTHGNSSDEEGHREQLARTWVDQHAAALEKHAPEVSVDDAVEAVLSVRRAGLTPNLLDVKQIAEHGLEAWSAQP